MSFCFLSSGGGEIASFGWNNKGQCGLGRVKLEGYEEPSVIPKVWEGNVVLLAAGFDHCVAVTGLFRIHFAISPSSSSLCLSVCILTQMRQLCIVGVGTILVNLGMERKEDCLVHQSKHSRNGLDLLCKSQLDLGGLQY